jgi:hypothetical protein
VSPPTLIWRFPLWRADKGVSACFMGAVALLTISLQDSYTTSFALSHSSPCALQPHLFHPYGLVGTVTPPWSAAAPSGRTWPARTIALGSTLVSPGSSYSILTDLVVPSLTRTSLLALQFDRSRREVVLVRPWSPNRCPSFHVVDPVSIGLLVKCRWVSGGRRGGSVPVGAAP